MLGRGSSQPPDETGEARTRAVGQSEHGDGRLDRMRGDIDDPSKPTRNHAVNGRLHQLDRRGMLASSALIQSLRSQFRKSPAGGPPALLMRISGLGQAARMASRPSFVVTSATTATVSVPVADRISSAARSRISRRLATTTSFTPSPPRAVAQLLPKPMLAAQTIAVRPRRPKSIFFLVRLRRASRSSRRCPLIY